MSDSHAKRIRLTYGSTDALFAGQFIVNSTDDDLIVNFSSGYVAGSSPEEQVLPVHSRIALTRAGAARLVALLQQALAQPAGPTAESAPERPRSPQASLPPIPGRSPN